MENKPKQDGEQVTFKFSKVSLTEAEKSLLVKSLTFLFPPKQLNYSGYLINFELLCKNIDNSKILSGDNLDLTKTKIKDTVLTAFCNYNRLRSYNIFLTQNLKL